MINLNKQQIGINRRKIELCGSIRSKT